MATKSKPRFGKGSNFKGKGRAQGGMSGGKPGNTNALRNGRAIALKRLTVGELPKEMLSVRREGRAYRRTLESEVLRIRGAITLTEGHLIDTASAATIQAGICRWLLRERIAKMSPADIRGCTADLVKAKERRDAAVRALGLDRDDTEDVMAKLYQVEAKTIEQANQHADGAGGTEGE